MKKLHHQFLENLTLYSLTALLSSLLFCCHLCFPSIKAIFVSAIPNLCSHILSPKCLFVLGNIIIFVLVGESKLPNTADKMKEKEKGAKQNHDEDGGAMEEVEEEHALPLLELNERVEDFIARVNRQMWNEANLYH